MKLLTHPIILSSYYASVLGHSLSAMRHFLTLRSSQQKTSVSFLMPGTEEMIPVRSVLPV